MQKIHIKHSVGRELVKDRVLSLIHEQGLVAGDKILSQNQLAKIFKVNPLTARKALDELAAVGELYRVKGKGTFVGPAPESTPLLEACLVLPGDELTDPKRNPECWHIVQDIFKAFMHNTASGDIFSTMTYSPDDDIAILKPALDKFKAVFFLGELEFPRLINQIIEQGKPRVVLLQCLSDCELPCLRITSDEFEGTRKAIHFLANSGYRKIAFLGSSLRDEKFDGYRQGLEDYGIGFSEALVVRGLNSQNDGFRGASVLMGRNEEYDAVFVDTDLKAVDVVDYFRVQGIRVPDDLGVMGYDGVDNLVNRPPYLTTVRILYDEIVRQAILKVTDKQNADSFAEIVYVTGEIVKGKTTR